jgi:hypothetical protein
MTKKIILYTYQFGNMIHNTHTHTHIYIEITKTLNILTDKNYIIIQRNLIDNSNVYKSNFQ